MGKLRLLVTCKHCGREFDTGRRMDRRSFEKGTLAANYHTCPHCAARATYRKMDYVAQEETVMVVKPIPEGYHTVTPYLIVHGVPRLLEFLTEAFDAEEQLRLKRPDGSIMHVEVRIGDSVLMMGEPMGEFGPMPTSIYLYVDDCDAIYRRALQAGGTSVMPPANQPHAGDRYGGVKDPSGNIWWVATHVEDLTPAEQIRRAESPRSRPR